GRAGAARSTASRPSTSTARRGRSPGLLLLEAECGGVDAVAEAGGRGAVREDVAEVALAGRAEGLRAAHEEASVLLEFERALRRRRREGRPPAARVVLLVRAEDLRAAARTAIDALLERVVVLAAERPLGPFFAQDPVLLGGQLAAPLLLG